ncbi:hypothetical protein CC78DRAFT_574009 [Lojkania enalia]|uniref:Uncharacterized protein n=1 Tax=Lojkania enalia TaxID=147567 RepID=A0A9P4NCI3_9PLEO|nr:hypothetical protein CC78DRAFT_574009 [Didymosphaeria enalia]
MRSTQHCEQGPAISNSALPDPERTNSQISRHSTNATIFTIPMLSQSSSDTPSNPKIGSTLADCDQSNLADEQCRMPLPQFDGPHGRLHPANTTLSTIVAGSQRPVSASNRATVRPQSHVAANAATELLPYCTCSGRLSNEQLIGLSDVAGSLREVVLLTLGAAVDDGQRSAMENAVGAEVAAGIIEFFADEWVADM